LAGHGGEGEEIGAGAAVDVGWWHRGSLESAPSAAAPKRRRRCAAAIFGHRGGPAALGLHGLSLFFLLLWRIFLDLGVAENAAAPPSGLVPGGCRGGRAARSTFVGGEARPDCFWRSFFWCCMSNLGTYVLFLFSFGVISVNVRTTVV
jgi:hypothetical protein